MEKGETRGLRTLTVLGSSSVAHADGRASIVFETKEEGAIAFEVDRRAIAALRREIAAIETFLSQAGSS